MAPAVVNFTSLANPAQVGSGWSGLNTCSTRAATRRTLPASPATPCFCSQEFCPPLHGSCETQSMFPRTACCWTTRTASKRCQKRRENPSPAIQAMTEARQPFRRLNERQIALVAYFERDLYAMARPSAPRPPCWHWPAAGERKILGWRAAPAAGHPHLLNQESACAYHGYLLALMAVEQTCAYFLKTRRLPHRQPAHRTGSGRPLLGTGNGMTHDETLQSLTGEGFQCSAAGRGVQPECRRGVATGTDVHGGGAAAPTGRGGTPSTPISGWCTGRAYRRQQRVRGAHAGRLRGLDPAP